MRKKSTSQSVSANLRFLVSLLIAFAAVFLALLGFGAFSLQAQQMYSVTTTSIEPARLPPCSDCSRFRQGIHKQENFRAVAMTIHLAARQKAATVMASADSSALESGAKT